MLFVAVVVPVATSKEECKAVTFGFSPEERVLAALLPLCFFFFVCGGCPWKEKEWGCETASDIRMSRDVAMSLQLVLGL